MTSRDHNVKQLKILIVTHHRFSKAFVRPGALGEYLALRGHEVTMIVTAERNRIHWAEHQVRGVRVLESPDLLWGRLRTGWDLWATIARANFLIRNMNEFDIVHLFETRPSVIFPYQFAKRRSTAPVIIDWNDWWGGTGGIIEQLRPRWYSRTFGKVEQLFETYYRRHAVGTTVISTGLRNRVIDMGVPSESILQLPGGTRPEKWEPKTAAVCRSLVSSEYAGKLGSKVVGFSSLDSHIDMEIVFRAMRIVRDSIPDASLLVTGSTGPAVAQMARKFGVSESLCATGWLTDDLLPTYLGCSDVFVLPLKDVAYNRGRWPNKIADYANIGRPIITNDVGDMGPLVRRYQIGVVTKYDPTEFATEILNLLNNPRVSAVLGANARSLAEGELAMSNRASSLEEFYFRTIDNVRNLGRHSQKGEVTCQ